MVMLFDVAMILQTDKPPYPHVLAYDIEINYSFRNIPVYHEDTGPNCYARCVRFFVEFVDPQIVHVSRSLIHLDHLIS
jgi:hypothetical protein